jgi:hypothetical protein
MPTDRSRTLIAAGYAVGTILCSTALFDLVLKLRPFRSAEVTWRIGAVGTTTIQLGTLLLALLIFCVTASLLEHRWLLRALSVLALCAAATSLAILPLFSLDVLQLRNLVRPEAKATLDLTMGRAALTVLLSAMALAWIGVGAWRAAAVERGAMLTAAPGEAPRGPKVRANARAAAGTGRGDPSTPLIGRS